MFGCDEVRQVDEAVEALLAVPVSVGSAAEAVDLIRSVEALARKLRAVQIRIQAEVDRSGVHKADAFVSADGFADPVGWALDTLGLISPDEGSPAKVEVQQRFRELLRTAHPDTGGTDAEAASASQT